MGTHTNIQMSPLECISGEVFKAVTKRLRWSHRNEFCGLFFLRDRSICNGFLIVLTFLATSNLDRPEFVQTTRSPFLYLTRVPSQAVRLCARGCPSFAIMLKRTLPSCSSALFTPSSLPRKRGRFRGSSAILHAFPEGSIAQSALL